MIVSFTAIVISLFAAWYADDSAGEVVNVVVGRADDVVRIQGHISTNRIEPGRAIDCWFLLYNMGDVPLTDVHLRRFTGTGFQPTKFVPLKKEALEARKSVLFEPAGKQLMAKMDTQTFMATAEFEWKINGVEYRQQISLGPITVRSATEPRVFALSKAYVGHLKDLFLPLVLLWMTAMLTRQQRESETDRASWNLMLTKIHENAERYYLPIHAATRDAARWFAKTDVTNPASFNVVTFQVLLFRRRARVMFERVGGFQFSTREAEQIVVQCESAFLAGLHKDDYVTREELSSARALVGRYMEPHVFLKTVLTKPEVQKVRDGLIRWATTEAAEAKAAFVTLDILAAVIDYDINLIYRFWYEDPPDPLDEKTSGLADLRASQSASVREIVDLYKKYRRKMGKKRW
jgi:hypothetical protein